MHSRCLVSCFKTGPRSLLMLVFAGISLTIFAQINPPSSIAKMPADLDEVILNLGHNSTIVDLRVSSDGKYLWSLGDYGRDKIWDLSQARELRSISRSLPREGRYLPSSMPHKLRVHDNAESIYDLDLKTGDFTKTDQKVAKNYLFPSDNLESQVFSRHQLEALQFSLPNETILSRVLNPAFTAHRYLFNAKRNLISVYGEFQAGRKVMLSFHGAEYQNSIALDLNMNSKKYEFEDFWGWPATDSLLGKNNDGELFIFHPLKKDPLFRPFDSGRKINHLVFSPNQEVYALALKHNGAVEIRNVKDKSLILKRYFTSSRISKLVFTPSGENLLFSDGNIIWNWDLKADTVLQFGDFYEVNSNYKSYTTINILSSGKIVLQIPTFESRYIYKIIDLHQGLTHYKEAGFGSLVNTGDRILLGGAYGGYRDLLTEQAFLAQPWAPSVKVLVPSRLGDQWAVIKNDYDFAMWDQNQEKELFSKTVRSPLYQVVMDKRDSLIALGQAIQVLVLDAKTGQEKATIPIKTGSPYKLILKFSADSHYLFITNTEGSDITIWDLKSNSLFRNVSLQYSGFYLFNVTNDNQILFGLRAGSVVAYNLQGKELYNLDLGAPDLTAEYFPEDKLILAAAKDGRVFQIDAQSGTLLKTLHLGKCHQWVSIDQNQQFETSTGATQYVHYRTKTGGIGYFLEQKKSAEATESEPFPPLLKSVKISEPLLSLAKPSAPALATSDTLELVNLTLKTQLKDKIVNPANIHVSTLPFNSTIINTMYAKGDQYIIVQENSGQITILESTTQRWLKTIKLEKPSSVKAAVSKDGQLLACLDGNQTIHLYDIPTGTLLQKRTLGIAVITALTISANGQTLAAGSLEGLIYLFKTADLNSYKTIRPSSGKILTISFDGQKEQIACTDFYGSVFLYDLSSPDKIPPPKILGNYSDYGVVHQIEFRPNSSLILRATQRIFSLQYAETDKLLKNFVINTRSTWMQLNPSNPDRFYYQEESPMSHRWKVYNLKTFPNVDSIANSRLIKALSRDGKQALLDSGASYNLESRKQDNLTSVRTWVRNWDLIDSTMYYKTHFEVYRVDLRSAKSELIENKHLDGSFLKEGKKISFVGDFLDKNTTGKKVLGDTKYAWKLPDATGQNVVSDNGLYIACLWLDKDTAYVYSTPDLKVVYRLPLSTAEKGGLERISNNGRYLAIGQGWNNFRVYDLLTKKLLVSEDHLIKAPSFSPDNSVVIFFAKKQARVFSLQSTKLIQEIPQTPQLKSVQHLSSNGRFVLLSSADNPSQLWDLQKGILLGDFYFMEDEQLLPAWAFVSVNGRFDGSPEGLKKMYQIDENPLKSKDLPLNASAGYTPGLLSQLIK